MTSGEGWDKENLTQSFSGLNKGKTLRSFLIQCKKLIDINDDTSFRAHNGYYKKQIPPRDMTSNWTDEVFPPNEKSLTHVTRNKDVTEEELNDLKPLGWTKARDIFRGRNFVLYDTISMDDVEQGQLGNCYFLSVLSELGNRPEIYDKIFITKEKTQNGCYQVRLLIRGIPKVVSVDDFFPTLNGSFVFAHSGPGEIWVQLLEKAWAKVNTSYAETIAGIPSEAFLTLSEAPCVSLIHRKYQVEDLWNMLKKAKAKGYYLATNTDNDPNGEGERMGLVPGHAYSLTNLEEFDLEGGKKLRLLQLRNPWGNGEWKGNFNDKSASWDILPELKKKVDLIDKNDGIFYMDYNDFLHYYPYTFILKYHKNFYYNYKKIQQQSLEHNTCAKFTLTRKAIVKVGLHTKQVRFYDKVPDYEVQPARIIIAKYDSNTRKYKLVGSDYHTSEVLYAETPKHLEPGEYHIFLNVYWPYTTKNTYTLSTYSSCQIEIEQLNKQDIPDDYLEQILIDYMDTHIKKDLLSRDTTIQISDRDNDLGFYMALINNESDNQFKFSASVQYSNLIFLQDDLVSKRIKNPKTQITTDNIIGILRPRERKILVWKLLKEPWFTKINIIEKKLFAYKEEKQEEDEVEMITRAFGGLEKIRLNNDLFYSEIDNGQNVILVFKNISRKIYKFNIEFDNLENLTVNGSSWTTGATIPLVSDKLYCINLVKNDTTLPYNFTYRYSYKVITGEVNNPQPQ